MKSVFFGLISLVFVLFACQSESEETVTLADISPSSSKNTAVKKDTLASDLDQKPIKSVFLQLSDSLFPDAKWKALDSLLFPDRFGAKKSEKWILTTTNDSLTFMQFQFSDSLRTKNAFFNWLDCFGANCTSYKVGGNVKIKNRNAMFLVGEKALVLVESSKKIDEKGIVVSLERDSTKQNWSYLVTMPRKGKSNWKKVKNGHFTKL
ncbi:MAG: hypothetical protein KA734_05155 [Fluviicola sp.]|nr:hypothetical protein [Fluviicola sp.]MBP6272658.1 hypothetical protein [Fluviicola sp.]